MEPAVEAVFLWSILYHNSVYLSCLACRRILRHANLPQICKPVCVYPVIRRRFALTLASP